MYSSKLSLLLFTALFVASFAEYAQIPLMLAENAPTQRPVPGNLSAFVIGDADDDLLTVVSLDYNHHTR